MSKITPVILCGGSGTRLWPRSRATKPKPFLPLLGKDTLYQATLSRCADRELFGRPLVVVGEGHLEFAKAQAGPIAPDAMFIVEPFGRNTAPAIALAAKASDPHEVLLVCPSDHFIANEAAFRTSAEAAARLAVEGWLVAFGIEATAPETGYGYIRRGDELNDGFRIERFVEKPDLQTARSFLDNGGYTWNGGIFSFRADLFLEELGAHRPEMAAGVADAWMSAAKAGTEIRPDADAFAKIEGESVDYAVMENTSRAAMVEAAMGWSDIGNWNAVFEQREKDSDGNVVMGAGQIVGGRRNMIDTDGPHVTIVGGEDLIVVCDGDDVLVVARDAVQRVGEASRCRDE